MKLQKIDFSTEALIKGLGKRHTAVDNLNTSSLITDGVSENISGNQTLSVSASANNLSNQTNTSEYQSYKEHAKNVAILLSSLAVGVGSGMALMPLFNEELETLEKFNINIHNHPSWLILSTVNTGLAVGSCATIATYHALNNAHKSNDHNNCQKLLFAVATTGAAMTTLLQLGLMWNIEIKNQEIEGSSGFDQFMAWATFSTVPLIICSTIENSEKIKKVISGEDHQTLHSLGEKLAVYGIAVTSFIPRAIAYTAITKEVSERIGFGEDSSTAIGVTLGGVLSASFAAIVEYASVKEIFNTKDSGYSLKEKLLGTFSSLEGAWFSLATISNALKSVPNWNSLLDGALFFPYFVSRTTYEATSIFNTFSLLSEHQEDKFTIESEVIGDIHSDE